MKGFVAGLAGIVLSCTGCQIGSDFRGDISDNFNLSAEEGARSEAIHMELVKLTVYLQHIKDVLGLEEGDEWDVSASKGKIQFNIYNKKGSRSRIYTDENDDGIYDTVKEILLFEERPTYPGRKRDLDLLNRMIVADYI